MSKRITIQEKRKLSDTPIRKCSPSCYLFQKGGRGCQYYQDNKVKHGDACLYDLTKMREYTEAFLSGDNSIIKNDASEMTAIIMSQLRRMLEQVNLEGVTVLEPILDAKGNPIYVPDPNWNGQGVRQMVVAMRIKDHPLISRVIQLTRSLGINLNEFKLTPKSADEKMSVSGHLIVGEQLDLTEVLAKRKEVEDRFAEAIKKGDEMLKQDPVYKQLLEEDSDVI